MDILLQNGANPDGIYLIDITLQVQEWGESVFLECASKGHIKLLEFLLNCGIQLNAHIAIPENLHEKFILLRRASYCGKVEVVRYIVNQGADINFRSVKKHCSSLSY